MRFSTYSGYMFVLLDVAVVFLIVNHSLIVLLSSDISKASSDPALRASASASSQSTTASAAAGPRQSKPQGARPKKKKKGKGGW